MTIIGEETVAQLKKAEENPDIMIGCVGGGSNFSRVCISASWRPHQKWKWHAVHRRGADELPYAYKGRGTKSRTCGDVAGFRADGQNVYVGHDFVPSPIHGRRAFVITAMHKSLSLLKNLATSTLCPTSSLQRLRQARFSPD